LLLKSHQLKHKTHILEVSLVFPELAEVKATTFVHVSGNYDSSPRKSGSWQRHEGVAPVGQEIKPVRV